LIGIDYLFSKKTTDHSSTSNIRTINTQE